MRKYVIFLLHRDSLICGLDGFVVFRFFFGSGLGVVLRRCSWLQLGFFGAGLSALHSYLMKTACPS